MGETPTSFKPYVPDDMKMPELTWSALLLGTSLGLIFSASSLYLVLKVGMTVSASIPVAVLAITLFRGLSQAFGFRRATILENNIVQTSGSAGESIAFGVGVTMPALLMLGFEMDLARVMVVSVLGGLLGILAIFRSAVLLSCICTAGPGSRGLCLSGRRGGRASSDIRRKRWHNGRHRFCWVRHRALSTSSQRWALTRSKKP